MGVLGWGFDQTLDTPMIAIERALNARHKLVRSVLQAIFGKPEDWDALDVPANTRTMTPALFNAIFMPAK